MVQIVIVNDMLGMVELISSYLGAVNVLKPCIDVLEV